MRVLAIAALAGGVLLCAPGPAIAAGDPLRAHQWGLDIVESDPAHAISDGSGALVAVVDTGAAFGHPDLQGRLVAGYDFVGGDPNPADGNGHGTHVAGIVAANAGNNVGVSSVAPAARVLAVRVLDNEGHGSTSDVGEGINYAVDHGADVINLSLTTEVPLHGTFTETSEAIERALDRGVIVVAAAGNDSLPFCDQPVGEERLLCVGGVDRNRQPSEFSNWGYGLAITAPAGSHRARSGIASTWHDGGYKSLIGTSQAAPHVAAVAGLLVSKGIRGQVAVRRILNTATDAGAPGDDPDYGAGIVNARQAVAGLPPLGTPAGPAARSGAETGGSRGTSRRRRARIYLRRLQRIRTVLRRGLRVRCRAAGRGRCRVVAKRRRMRVAAGSRRVRLGRRATVTARPTRAGRRLLRRALRRRTRVRLRVAVALPGARRSYRVTLVP